MFAAFTRVPTHGISTAVVTKLARLAGADQLHIGAIQGKLYEPDEIVIANARICLKEFHNITPCLPVSSGGQHAGKIAINCKLLGKDALILAGGGVLGHPKSVEAGARSMRQALEAYMKKIPVKEYAEDKPELKIALQTWGEVPVTF
jgi:ribulose-bisphosphate carboxylase large chain